MDDKVTLNWISKIAAEVFLDNQSPIWSIYRILNESREEVYFGVSKDPKNRILTSHAQHKTKAITHWDFQNDSISFEILREGLDKYMASAIAHEYEKLRIPGYRVIQTSGT